MLSMRDGCGCGANRSLTRSQTTRSDAFKCRTDTKYRPDEASGPAINLANRNITLHSLYDRRPFFLFCCRIFPYFCRDRRIKQLVFTRRSPRVSTFNVDQVNRELKRDILLAVNHGGLNRFDNLRYDSDR